MEDKNTKLFLGVLLGEIYRLQKRFDMCPVSDATIYGLLNGFEDVINEQINPDNAVSSEEITCVEDILSEYFNDEDKMASFSGFYDIEHRLKACNIDRMKAKRILTYLKADDRFVELIEKMDSSNSPGECRKFEIRDYEK